MTVIAGCYCLDDFCRVPSEIITGLTQHLRRVNDSRGAIKRFVGEGFFLTKWDSGAFGEPAWLETSDGGIAALIGDPLFTDTENHIPRAIQLEKLNLFDPEIEKHLAMTRGSFSAVYFSPVSRKTKLATDALGVRSLYYTVQQGLLIFASALRILEALPSIQRKISLLGCAEQSIYGQPLGSKTAYEDILVLRESEILTACDGEVTLTRYYDWTRSSPYPDTEKQAAAWLYGIFVEGVRLRAIDDEHTFAFLSGGMDSRAIVATLMACGNSVVSLNFSPDNSQDQEYAIRFAKAAGSGCRLFSHPFHEDSNFSLLAYNAKASLEKCHRFQVERPEVVWSGDGGSVGLGHVYMDERMVDLCEQASIDEAARHFMDLHRNYLPEGVLKRTSCQFLQEKIFHDVVSEIKRYSRQDTGRQIYLFLLMNDQRRHLYKHFESIDEHGLEFLTPFFDTAFLTAVATTPVRWGILHRLYALWFENLPNYAYTTPWQTYPGHVECPVPAPSNLSYQWTKNTSPVSRQLANRVELALDLVKSIINPMPKGVFSKFRIMALAISVIIGLREGEYVRRTIRVFQNTLARTH